MPTSSTVPGAKGEHLFVYGTLVEPAKLDEVLGHRHLGERLRARLPGYRRLARVSEEFPYAIILPSPGDAVDGILVLDLSAADLVVLDEYEEVGQGTYARTRVAVEGWGCGPHPMSIEAHTYVAGVELADQAAAAAHGVEPAAQSTAS
jgi:gamma-glutamylcyclotransferase (GGCT)/AIG2-like uncharacterized protein YtfP